ncbi:hypothetical protein [Microscilla marina]|nr:hypothetical protein [Microscilla marina]
MKNVLKGLLMFTLVVLMASCADKNKLIAKAWVIDLNAGKAEAENKEKSVLDKIGDIGKGLAENLVLFEFKPDGTFRAGGKMIGADAGKWKIEGNQVKILDGEGKEVSAMNIVKLTEEQLVLSKEGEEKKIYLKPKK